MYKIDRNIDLTPKNDVIFKKLFGDQRHPKFLIALLNTVLKPESPIKTVTIKNPELINAAKVLVAEAIRGQEYQNMKKVTTINIINFKLFDTDNYWNKFFLMNPETGERLTDLLAIHFFELPKVHGPSIDDPVTFWLEFIKNPEAQQIKGDYAWNCVYDELKQRYYDIVADPEVQELIRIRDKAERDYNSAILQARMEEKAKAQKAIEKERLKAEKEKARAYQEKIESARRFLEMGVPLEQVAQGTGLSVEEIKELK